MAQNTSFDVFWAILPSLVLLLPSSSSFVARYLTGRRCFVVVCLIGCVVVGCHCRS